MATIMSANTAEPSFGLIVDDDEIQCTLIAEAFKQCNLQSVSSCSQRQLENINYQRCCIIVLDLNMPELSGIDVLNLFAQRKLDVPIIILSAADPCMINIAATYGKKLGLNIVETVKKPFVFDTFYSCVRRVIPALQANDKKTPGIAGSMPQIAWAARPDGWVIYLNRQWVEYTGRSLQESYGYGWSKSFHPKDGRDSWKKLVGRGRAYSRESQLRGADNVYRWWRIQATPMHDAGGNIIKWFGTCTDIDDLKKTGQTISADMARFRELFDAAPIPVVA